MTASPLSATCAADPAHSNIADRILDCFPSGSYALGALLRLLDIVESTEIPTAAVECHVQPRLLVNPDFVAQHANTPEKLLMLVMHELHHVLLGHTTLFGAATPVKNFVFDAVINSLICRMFPDERYTSFFTDYYSGNKFPECLLRPPTGWPHRYTPPAGISELNAATRKIIKELHLALYSDGGATYKEVFDILPQQLSESGIGNIPLIGDHSADGAMSGGIEQRSPLLFDVVRGIVEQWPQPPNPIAGRSLADILRAESVRAIRPPSARAVLRQLIRRVASVKSGGRRRRPGTTHFSAQLPIPNFDRRTTVLRALGHSPLLHSAPVAVRRPTRTGAQVHIYIDVSGSMDSIKGPLYGAVLDCKESVHPRIHLFSTAVATISLDELRRGVCHSTGGTDISCVAEHMARERITRAVIVTDGYVGRPRGQHFHTLDRAKIAVGLIGQGASPNDLASVADHTATIPIGEPS